VFGVGWVNVRACCRFARNVRGSVQRLFDTFKLMKTSLLSTHSYHKRIYNSTSLKVIAAPLPNGFCVTAEICALLGTLLTALTLRP
jgi:hypothetical protein